MPFDRKKFNDDPKHEADRTQFDEMLEDSLLRIKAKNDKTNPPKPKDENLFDGFYQSLFGKKPGE